MSDTSKYSKEDFIRFVVSTIQHNSEDKNKAKEFLSSEGLNVDSMVSEGLKRIKRIQLKIQAEEDFKSQSISIPDETGVKVYVTKYALTNGIQVVEVDALDGEFPDMVKTKGTYAQYFHKGEWHKTWKEAIEKANEMKRKKILSLNKQIKRIEDLKF